MVAAFLVALTLPFIAQSQPPRDRTMPPTTANASAREAELQKRIAATPKGVAAFIELATLQENRGSFADAEQTLTRAREAAPTSKDVVIAFAGLYNRHGDFTKTIQMLEEVERLDPTDAAAPQITATYYWEKAFKDHRLLPAERYKYVMDGIAATDRALALNPDYADALVYKNLLLRIRANLETDPVLKQQLIAEADTLRNRAIELNKQRTAINSADRGVTLAAPQPPPPPPPPPPATPDGPRSLAAPTKIKDVRPAYPPEAMAAGIQGVVVVEVSIDTEGHVRGAKVLRSIPELDEAALAAVRQWEFAPAVSQGVAVPVVATVTVNFTLQ
jgi:TonB family protein